MMPQGRIALAGISGGGATLGHRVIRPARAR